MEQEQKVVLLKNIISDIISNGKKKEWKTYSLEVLNTAEFGENCRTVWKAFRTVYFPQNKWCLGAEMEESFKVLATRAIAINNGQEVINDEIPEGFQVTKMFQQQNKNGEVLWLKSVEKDKEADKAKNFYDLSVEAFQNIVLNYEPNKIYLLPQSEPTAWGMNLLTADAHIGSTIKDSMFGNKYSKDIYLDRVRTWIDVIEKQHEKYGTFKYLNVIGLGDFVDGYEGKTTRPSSHHTLPQDLNSAEQFDTYVKSFIDFFNTIVQEGFAEKIRFVSATNSNHGGDFEYACSRAVEVYLNAKYPDIETIVSRDFMFHIKSGKHVQILLHGKDRTHMRQNISWVLTKENEQWIENYVNYHSLNKDIPFNQEKQYVTAYLGDLHQTKTEFMKRFRYKRIMSMYGQSDWVEMNFSKSFGYQGFEWEVFDTSGPTVIEGREFYL